MKKRVLLAALTVGTVLLARPSPLAAQFLAVEDVLVLPPFAAGELRELAGDLYDDLLAAITVPPGKMLVERSRAEELLGDRRLSDIVENTAGLSEFAGATGMTFLVATVLRRQTDGRLELSSVVFSREEREILNCVSRIFADEAALRAGIAEVGHELSRASSFSSTDSAFFLSLVIPGLGQVLKEKPLHALISAGLFGGAFAYALSVPQADPFEFDRDKFTTQYGYADQSFRYFLYGNEVTAGIFFAAADEDWEHHLKAGAERRLKAVRRRRATGLVAAAYLFNLVDALVLTREQLDTRPFFIGLEAIPDPGTVPGSEMLRLQVRVTFR